MSVLEGSKMPLHLAITIPSAHTDTTKKHLPKSRHRLLRPFYDMTKPTRLSTDASRQGLGFILQQQTEGQWTLIQAGSRFYLM